MAIQTPACNDSEWQLLFKILQSLPDISTGGGGSDIIVQDEGVQLTAALAQMNFVGDGVTATAVGNNVTVTIPGSSSGTIQSGTGVVVNGANSLAVVFPVAFASPPVVVAAIGHPTGEANNIVNILTDTVTALGFTARLTGAAPSANYRILWHAHL